MKTPQPKPGILSISPYVAGKSSADNSVRIIKLSSNENPYGPSPKAIAAYAEQAQTLTRYPDSGHAALRAAIGEVYQCPAEQLICGAGSDELIGLLIHAYAGLGDEVLFTEHGFLMYRIYTLGNSATPVVARETNLTADIDALLAAVTPKTRIVFLANPNNPTGTLIGYSEVERLRNHLRDDIILALDAAYSEYVQDANYHDGRDLVSAGSNTVVFHTFSKIYGLPALRLGFAYGPAAIIDVLNRIRGPFNVNSPAIAAAMAAVADTDYTALMRKNNTEQLTRVSAQLAQYGLSVVPSFGNFLLVKFPADAKKNAQAANQFLLKNGLIVRDVTSYGLPEYLRITIGTPEENTLLLDAIASFMHSSDTASSKSAS